MGNTQMFGDVAQGTPQVVADGNARATRQSRTGELFTQGWKQALALEGRVHSVTVGGITAGGNTILITGGGAGTTIDQDQPEAGVSVALNTTIIPIRIQVATQVDMDANGEVGQILVAYDTAAAMVGGTGTTPTVVNHITEGGVDSLATVLTAVTADITDPTVSGLLASAMAVGSDNGVAANAVVNDLRLDWQADEPFMLVGPAAFYVYWGGTAAVPGLATITWAEIPTSRISLS